jgi:hypothetical protein
MQDRRHPLAHGPLVSSASYQALSLSPHHSTLYILKRLSLRPYFQCFCFQLLPPLRHRLTHTLTRHLGFSIPPPDRSLYSNHVSGYPQIGHVCLYALGAALRDDGEALCFFIGKAGEGEGYGGLLFRECGNGTCAFGGGGRCGLAWGGVFVGVRNGLG